MRLVLRVGWDLLSRSLLHIVILSQFFFLGVQMNLLLPMFLNLLLLLLCLKLQLILLLQLQYLLLQEPLLLQVI